MTKDEAILQIQRFEQELEQTERLIEAGRYDLLTKELALKYAIRDAREAVANPRRCDICGELIYEPHRTVCSRCWHKHEIWREYVSP